MGKPWGRSIIAGIAIGGTVVGPLVLRVSSADGSTIQALVALMPPDPEGLSGISFSFDHSPRVSGSTSTVPLSGTLRMTSARLLGQLSFR